MIESTIEILSRENEMHERDTERIDLLQKKKTWLEVDAQRDNINSLNDASQVLREQVVQIRVKIQTYEEAMSNVAKKNPSWNV